jgi:pantothenate kinase
MVQAVTLTVEDLVGRAQRLSRTGARVMLGVTGPPGAGKSTLAARLAAGLGAAAVVVGMDGFHLAQTELQRLGRADRKGAPDTFDAAGYVALLRRLRAQTQEIVYAPLFRRDIEEPIANAVPVASETQFVITEGNYLLLDEPVWRDVRGLLDEVWFIDVPDEERRRRLMRRRVDLGVGEDEARRWTLGSDERNADTVARTRDRADLVVDVTDEQI